VISGYRLSNALDQVLCARYANKALTINMEDFLLLSVRLEAMFSKFCQEFLFFPTLLLPLDITCQQNLSVSVVATSH